MAGKSIYYVSVLSPPTITRTESKRNTFPIPRGQALRFTPLCVRNKRLAYPIGPNEWREGCYLVNRDPILVGYFSFYLIDELRLRPKTVFILTDVF